MDISPCCNYLLTGAYNNNGHIIDIHGNNNVTIDASFSRKNGKTQGKVRKYGAKLKLSPLEEHTNPLKYKINKGAWNPKENCIALVNRNCLFLDIAKKGK